MPRRPRFLIEGGIYHVYNRFTNGEPVFSEVDACESFLDLVREVKARDGLTIFAWCVMTNHFHLAVRTGAVPLSRSMRQIGGRFSQQHNLIYRRFGPLWQGRYKSRIVESPEYLHQLIVYIHMNPVRAGIVSEPGAYGLSGHRELVKKTRDPIVDVDDTLILFGKTLRTARKVYVGLLKAAGEAGWSEDLYEDLPWWRRSERKLKPKDVEYVDALGRSTGLERPDIEAGEFVRRVCDLMGVDLETVAGRGRDSVTAASRRTIATLGIERWGQRAKELARALNKHPDVVSNWASSGGVLRQVDSKFRKVIDDLDKRLSTLLTEGKED